MNRYLLLCILFLTVSCAHQSGRYVKWPVGQNLDELAKRFQVDKEDIQRANSNTGPGGWVFIPLKRGLLEFNRSQYMESTADYIRSGVFLWPVPAAKEVSSSFGRRWGRKHEGIDIPASIGADILAAADGTVIYSGNKIGGYGNITVIEHDNGHYTVYAHAKKNFTRRGQRVTKGQLIALVGMTGRSTGPHLHFEIRHNGRSLDPSEYLAFNFKVRD